MENTSVIGWTRQRHEEGLCYLGSSSQHTETAGLFQLVQSFNKGRGGPALLGGLFRVTVRIRLSKQKAAFQLEFICTCSCFPPFLKYLLFLCACIWWKVPVESSSGLPRLVPRSYNFFSFYLT